MHEQVLDCNSGNSEDMYCAFYNADVRSAVFWPEFAVLIQPAATHLQPELLLHIAFAGDWKVLLCSLREYFHFAQLYSSTPYHLRGRHCTFYCNTIRQTALVTS